MNTYLIKMKFISFIISFEINCHFEHVILNANIADCDRFMLEIIFSIYSAFDWNEAIRKKGEVIYQTRTQSVSVRVNFMLKMSKCFLRTLPTCLLNALFAIEWKECEHNNGI